MPITQLVPVELETYAEVRARLQREYTPRPTAFGLSVVAAMRQTQSRKMPYLERRRALLAARAEFSLIREWYGVDWGVDHQWKFTR